MAISGLGNPGNYYSFPKKQQNAPKEVETEVKQVAPKTNNTGNELPTVKDSGLILANKGIKINTAKPTQAENILAGRAEKVHNMKEGIKIEDVEKGDILIRELEDGSKEYYLVIGVDEKNGKINLISLIPE